MTRVPPRRVVVLGAGIAGLLAAAAAARSAESVLVVDRDVPPQEPNHRRGAPQAVHVHALLAAGQRATERLVPGFLTSLSGRGAHVVDFAADIAIHTPFGCGERFPSDLPGLCASRPLVEWAIRSHVLALPPVTLLTEHTCTGLVGDAETVTAVRLSTRSRQPVEPVGADLVIDATGRGSRIDHWLTELGCPPSPTRTVATDLRYASRTYRIPDGHTPAWRGCYVQPGPPRVVRGGVVMTVEGRRWIVSLVGAGHDRPSTRDESFLTFARGLGHPVIADTIAEAEPLTSVAVSSATASRRRYLERARTHPKNLVCVGDALCSLNPIYAQGMTIAAITASHLDDALTYDATSPNFARGFHRGLARTIDLAWLMTVTSDLRWPGVTGGRATPAQRCMARYADHVLATTTRNSHVQRRFLEVLNLLRPPWSLLAPATAVRTLSSVLTERMRNQRSTPGREEVP